MNTQSPLFKKNQNVHCFKAQHEGPAVEQLEHQQSAVEHGDPSPRGAHSGSKEDQQERRQERESQSAGVHQGHSLCHLAVWESGQVGADVEAEARGDSWQVWEYAGDANA